MAVSIKSPFSLTKQDVELLKNNPAPQVRSSTAQKVSAQYQGDISDTERKIAEDIFRLIANDVEIKVRQDLAESLKNCASLPRDIIEKIISDVSSVAKPLIECSELLSEQDLISLVKSHDEEKQIAVASRSDVSYRVSEALIEEGSERPVIVLVSNNLSKISDYAYRRIMERFHDREEVHRPLLMRSHVPVRILEKLINFVSDSLKQQLLMRRDLPVPLITAIVSQTREKAILSLSEVSAENEVRNLVIHLDGLNRLTPNLILRAACVGDMKFFEYSLAIKAGIPIRNARVLIYDSGLMGLERLYEETGLPANLYEAVRIAVQTYREMMEETEDGYRDHFCRRLLERVLIQFDDSGVCIDDTDMAYFLQKIGPGETEFLERTI